MTFAYMQKLKILKGKDIWLFVKLEEGMVYLRNEAGIETVVPLDMVTPIIKKKKRQTEMNQEKYLTEPEYRHLKRVLKRFAKEDSRNVAMIMVALQTGARATEILNLKQTDFKGNSVMITGLKGSCSRQIPISRDLFKMVKKLKGEKPFPISYSRLRQVWLEYRPVKKKFHSLRHCASVRLYLKTKDIRLVQFMLGHRSISNTEIYSRYCYTQGELKKAMGIK